MEGFEKYIEKWISFFTFFKRDYFKEEW